MGCDVTTLSKHNLNISNVEFLAIDLAERLNMNIDYGYYSKEEYCELLGIELYYSFMPLGSIKKNNNTARYLLIYQKYQQKLLYQKYGDELFNKLKYWSWLKDDLPDEEERLEEKKDVLIADFYLDSVDNTDAEGYLFIHDEILVNDLFYFSRWWIFCETIRTKLGWDDEYFQEFRKSVMQSTFDLGGNKAYSVNDQCKYLKGVGQGNEIYYNWNELEEFINSRKILEVISISKIMLDTSYKNEVENKLDSNLAFCDDFKDLI